MENKERDKDNAIKIKKEKLEKKKKFLGGYPIGEEEFYVMIHFLWITSFFALFIFVRILILISGVQ